MLRVLLILGLQQPNARTNGDSWLGPDKVKHFFMAAFVQSVAYSSIRAAGASHGSSLVAASAVTAGVSIGKEMWDARGNGTASFRDLTWDAAGAGAATLLLRHSVH
jgi:putative lipoprotein